MAHITTQEITDAGITITTTTLESESNTFTCTGREFIYITLAEGEDVTLTVKAQQTSVDSQVYGTLTKKDASMDVSINDKDFIGPFPVGAFADLDGNATFTVSSMDGVSVAVLSCDYS